MRRTCTDDWFKSENQKIKYLAVFRDPEDGEEYGFLGADDKTGGLHFRNLTGDREFWNQPKEDFLFAARLRGYELISIFVYLGICVFD